jgi:hypothetical protein
MEKNWTSRFVLPYFSCILLVVQNILDGAFGRRRTQHAKKMVTVYDYPVDCFIFQQLHSLTFFRKDALEKVILP